MIASGPLCFHIADLPDEGLEARGEVPFAALDIAADEATSYPEPMAYRLHIALVGDGILARGELSAVVTRMCGRCLQNGSLTLRVPDLCHHLEHVEDRTVDLTEHLREDILLAFPQEYVCTPECRGLCPDCGQNLNLSACDCRRDGTENDSWSALDTLGLSKDE